MNRRQAPPRGNDDPGGRENRNSHRQSRQQTSRRQGATPTVYAAEVPVLIPPGEYIATGGAHQLRRPFGAVKLYVDFDVEVTDNAVVRLQRYYNVKAGPTGGFTAGASSHYFREWAMATGRRPSKGQPLSPAAFVGVHARVAIETVSVDGMQRDLDPVTGCYSRVARILEVLNRCIP